MTDTMDGVGSALPPNVEGAVVTVGTFDGMHLGHHAVIERLAAHAARAGLPSVLVTFDPHPLEIVNPAIAPPLLTPGREKLEVMAASGVDYVAVVPFTQTLASYEAEDFVDVVLRGRMRMRELLIGHDHGLGKGRSGDVGVLRQLGATRGFDVEVVPPVTRDAGPAISSSGIRRALAEGDLAAAESALGRRYAATGRVVHGERRGRLLGYPTINVEPESKRKLLPPPGVYAVAVQTPLGPFAGMMNLGPRPTFGDERTSIEVHLFDTSADLYGAPVRIDFVERLRDVRKFDSVDGLVQQLGRDEQAARLAIDRAGVPTVIR